MPTVPTRGISGQQDWQDRSTSTLSCQWKDAAQYACGVSADPTPSSRPYHHGDLRRTLIQAALDVIEREGLATLRLRDLARRVGVSHAAPVHHFGDKAGLLTAVATDGFSLLAHELQDTYARTGSFLEVGAAYVRFAVQHRAYFEVMFRPELYHATDPALDAARRAARELLFGPVAQVPAGSGEPQRASLAAWSLAHGLATLLLSGNLPPELTRDPEDLARSVAAYLFGSPA
jgi:AcrR family transcriptional regulator